MPVLNLQIAAGGDDGRELAGTVTLNSLNSGEIDATTDYIAGQYVVTGPVSGATVNSATLTVAVTAGTADEFLHTVYADDVDNSAALTTGANDISARTPTTAVVTWGTGADLGLAADADASLTVTSVVQEIFSRAGWASGNRLTMIIRGGSDALDDMQIHMFEGALGAAKAMRLDIDYTNPSSGQPMRARRLRRQTGARRFGRS